ncbi:hypothetical protein ACQKWADRAFT_306492 [Trichoderma austrokoningii]
MSFHWFKDVQYARRYCKVYYYDNKKTSNGRVSRRALRRALQKEFRHKWKAMNRTPIPKETAASQLSFAQAWMDKVEELMEVCFS